MCLICTTLKPQGPGDFLDTNFDISNFNSSSSISSIPFYSVISSKLLGLISIGYGFGWYLSNVF